MPKRDTHIPVTVLPNTPRPAPSIPPTPAPVVPPVPPKKPSPVRRARTDAQKRRLMWLIVLIGSGLALAGIILLWPLQNKNGTHDTLIGKIITTLTPPAKSQPTPAQQEIRNLDKQVFPQFQ